ncbi:hypothetical protein Hanom_Chr09g00851801 [Helianthus anomalus]
MTGCLLNNHELLTWRTQIKICATRVSGVNRATNILYTRQCSRHLLANAFIYRSKGPTPQELAPLPAINLDVPKPSISGQIKPITIGRNTGRRLCRSTRRIIIIRSRKRTTRQKRCSFKPRRNIIHITISSSFPFPFPFFIRQANPILINMPSYNIPLARFRNRRTRWRRKKRRPDTFNPVANSITITNHNPNPNNIIITNSIFNIFTTFSRFSTKNFTIKRRRRKI